MAVNINILPPIIELNDFSGNWENYIEAIYKVFKCNFIDKKCVFGSNELKLKWHPILPDGKAYTFYHMTHKGNIEKERIPDLRRCERMPWASPTIENCVTYQLKFWEQERKGESRVCIWLEVSDGDNYFVILNVRKNYVLLWTAFYAEYNNALKKKQKEYDEWQKVQMGKKWTPDELIKDIQSRLL